jgi:electron transfer flavoprotein beta subunit
MKYHHHQNKKRSYSKYATKKRIPTIHKRSGFTGKSLRGIIEHQMVYITKDSVKDKNKSSLTAKYLERMIIQDHSGVKRVIDYAVSIRVKPDFSGVVKEQVKMSMNPFDEIALEAGVKLKEKGLVNEIVSVSIGPDKSQEVLRTALAKGSDRAILIQHDENLEVEPLAVAKILQKMVDKEKPDLVLLGKQAIDDDACQTPQILASRLKWQQATFVSKLDVDTEKKIAQITREIDGGLETLKVKLPAVVSCDLRLNEPRFASLKAIMAAKKKPLETLKIDELGVDYKNRTKITKVTEPKKRQGGSILKDVNELYDKLRNEAKVI